MVVVSQLCPQYQLSIWQQLTPTFVNFIFGNFIPTYHLLHVCGHQTLLCARLAACRVPLVKLVKMWPGRSLHVVVGTLKISLDQLKKKNTKRSLVECCSVN